MDIPEVSNSVDVILISIDKKEFRLKREHAVELRVFKILYDYFEFHYYNLENFIIETKFK